MVKVFNYKGKSAEELQRYLMTNCSHYSIPDREDHLKEDFQITKRN